MHDNPWLDVSSLIIFELQKFRLFAYRRFKFANRLFYVSNNTKTENIASIRGSAGKTERRP